MMMIMQAYRKQWLFISSRCVNFGVSQSSSTNILIESSAVYLYTCLLNYLLTYVFCQAIFNAYSICRPSVLRRAISGIIRW